MNDEVEKAMRRRKILEGDTTTEKSPTKNGGLGLSDIIPPPLAEAGVMFPAGKMAWGAFVLLWLIAGAYLIISFKFGLLFVISYIIAFLAWVFIGFRQVNGDERAKSLLLGKILKGIIGPGPTFTLFPLEILRIYPTTMQTLPLTDPGKPAGIQTKAGQEEQFAEDGTVITVPIPKVILPVEPVLVFQWPWIDEELTATVRHAPPPDDLRSLRDLIEEPILDVIRTAGGQWDYIRITQNRTAFAEEVKELFKEHKDLASLIDLIKLKNALPSFKHIDTPKSVVEGQSAEAASFYTGRAERTKTILKAEGDKRAKILAGEGQASYEAAVRTAILKVLTTKEYSDVAMKLEGMKAFIDASQGGKGTIIFPTELLSALGGLLGGKSSSGVLGDLEKAGITQEKLAEIIMAVLTQKKMQQSNKKG